MNERQQTALQHPCRLEVETLHPRFRHQRETHNLILTLNAGYE